MITADRTVAISGKSATDELSGRGTRMKTDAKAKPREDADLLGRLDRHGGTARKQRNARATRRGQRVLKGRQRSEPRERRPARTADGRHQNGDGPPTATVTGRTRESTQARPRASHATVAGREQEQSPRQRTRIGTVDHDAVHARTAVPVPDPRLTGEADRESEPRRPTQYAVTPVGTDEVSAAARPVRPVMR